MKRTTLAISVMIIMLSVAGMTACAGSDQDPAQAVELSEEAAQTGQDPAVQEELSEQISEQAPEEPQKDLQEEDGSAEPETATEPEDAGNDTSDRADTDPETEIVWDPSWEYADYSKIHDDTVTLYRSDAAERKDYIVAVNAGHGTSGGTAVKTLCHPDGSAKVVTGSTQAGATEANAVSGGMTFTDGTPEADATLSLALLVKEELLASGYDVLMLREDEDVQLDNIARTVFANQNADCHISLHYDSTDSNKGAFYIGVPETGGYRSMEPVASWWQEHEALGQALISGMRENGVPVFGEGRMAIDMTQTSYSTIPSVDLEVGDRASDHSESMQREIAESVVLGLDNFR